MDNGQGIPNTPDVGNPYVQKPNGNPSHKYVPQLDQLDNNNTIIVFDNSESGSITDTLLAARGAWEARWRRLPFYLAYEAGDVSDDNDMALECSKIILQDIWKAVTDNWQSFLDACNSHVSILEDRIYEQPADESRAPELWSNSSVWLKVERLVAIHLAIAREMQTNLRELTGDDDWLEATPNDMIKVTELVQDDLVKPTANLSDLMYKSVGIRDSRHSLQLNLSMWRLSWITFVFLPLTFISSFFGMNVDILANNPALRYYFASAIPMMVIVIIMYFIFKNYLAIDSQGPYQRGIWEENFHRLAIAYPQLWSRLGPRGGIHPRNSLDRLKWGLIQFWNQPQKTIHMRSQDPQWDDLGMWTKCKRNLTARWTAQIRTFTTDGDSDAAQSGLTPLALSSTTSFSQPETAAPAFEPAAGDNVGSFEPRSNIGSSPTPFTATETLPAGMLEIPVSKPSVASIPQQRVAVAQQPALQQQLRQQRRSSSAARSSSLRPSSAGSSGNRNSGVMVEEEGPDWLRQLLGDGRRTGSSGARNQNITASGDIHNEEVIVDAHKDENR